MLFNSYIFVFLFLPITLFGYFFLNRFHWHLASKYWLVACSLFFYGYFNFSYLWIIVSSIVVNYVLCSYFEKSKSPKSVVRKLLYALGLAFNIGLLVFYKYLDFFFEIASNFLNADPIYMGLILPLGISFFTFQQISYLIDSYKGNAKTYNLIDYSLFVTFFPQLIAGPIVLHSEIIPQFEDKNNQTFHADQFAKGLFSFSRGLAKKVLIADNFGKIVTFGFSHIFTLSSFEAILTILAYVFQIYFDFSGYCDMACGIACMFNIELPLNFNSPYKAKNISEFWKRWHITLTRFLTNYIYIPLGGNRYGQMRTYLNTLIVFLASGIWHGAGYTFILWGCLHGLSMVFYRAFKRHIDKLPSAVSWLATFAFVSLTWVYFRAETVESANILILRIFSGGFTLNFELTETLLNIIPISIVANLLEPYNMLNLIMIAVVIVFICICIGTPNVQERTKAFTPKFSNLISTAFLLIWSILSLSGVSIFLYFNF